LPLTGKIARWQESKDEREEVHSFLLWRGFQPMWPLPHFRIFPAVSWKTDRLCTLWCRKL